MEIKEIVSYYFNNETNLVDVSFRTIEDEEDVVRIDTIDYSVIESYGLIHINFSLLKIMNCFNHE
jgi:hypothetical protein